jgi:diacylglycerol kinase
MTELKTNKQKFSIIKRAKSFTHAGRGLWIFIKTTHNAWVHITFLIIAIFLGIFFDITHIEWMLLILVSGLVLTAEAFNTAIEIDMDLTSPNYHPYARDTKDVAAGAVLVSTITAIVVGFGIFGHYFILFAQLFFYDIL